MAGRLLSPIASVAEEAAYAEAANLPSVQTPPCGGDGRQDREGQRRAPTSTTATVRRAVGPPDAPRPLHHRLHHTVGPRLRPRGRARTRPARPLRHRHETRAFRRAGGDRHRACVFDAASRQPAARLAGAVAMAVELAFARGRDGLADIRSAALVGLGGGDREPLSADTRPARYAWSRRHGVVHGDDLCLAEIRAGLAHPADAALLSAVFAVGRTDAGESCRRGGRRADIGAVAGGNRRNPCRMVSQDRVAAAHAVAAAIVNA